MQLMKFTKTVESIEQKCDEMTDEQKAHLAGKLMISAGVARHTVEAMLRDLTQEELWEFSEQVPAVVNELMEAFDDDDQDEDDE